MAGELEDRLKAAGIEVETTWTVGKDFVHENQIWKGFVHVDRFNYDGSNMTSDGVINAHLAQITNKPTPRCPVSRPQFVPTLHSHGIVGNP